MGVTQVDVGLNKQADGDANWDVALNSGFDDANTRLTLSGAGAPSGVDGSWIGQTYWDTTNNTYWGCTATGSPGTWEQIKGHATVGAVGSKPASAPAGTLYYATDEDKLYVNTDGSTTWEALLRETEVAALVRGKNALVNGDFAVWQREASWNAIALETATADNWEVFAVGSPEGKIDCDRVETPLPSDLSTYCMKLAVDTVDSSIGASQGYGFRTYLEGYDAARFGFGESGAKEFTISFWVKSSVTGDYGFSIANGAENRSIFVMYNIASTNWEKKTITWTADTGGTYNRTNGTGVSLRWMLAAGSDFEGVTENTWQTDNNFCDSSQENFMGNAGATFIVGPVQMEPGDIATPFEYIPVATQTERCERYYEKTYDLHEYAGDASVAGAVFVEWEGTSHSKYHHVIFHVRKRIAPSIAVYSTSGAINKVRVEGADKTWVGLVGNGESGFSTGTDDATDGTMQYQWVADARLT